jgi:hypothetical protein
LHEVRRARHQHHPHHHHHRGTDAGTDVDEDVFAGTPVHRSAPPVAGSFVRDLTDDRLSGGGGTTGLRRSQAGKEEKAGGDGGGGVGAADTWVDTDTDADDDGDGGLWEADAD